MMYEMRRRKPKTTLLLTQGIFNLLDHIHMVWEELAIDDAVSYKLYTMKKWIATQLNVMAGMEFIPLSPASPTLCHKQLSYLPTLRVIKNLDQNCCICYSLQWAIGDPRCFKIIQAVTQAA